MTIETQTNSVSFFGNGITTDFPANFPFLEDQDLLIELYRESGEVEVLALGTDYTVNRVGANIGGMVVLVVPPVTGDRLYIERRTPRKQPIDLTPGAVLPSETLERGFDRLTLIDVDAAANISRTLQAPALEGRVSPLVIPGPDQRASKVLGFDDDGNPVAVGSLTAVEEVGAAVTAAEIAQAAAEVAQAAAEADQASAQEAREAAQAAARTARGLPDPLGHDGKVLMVEEDAPIWKELPTATVETAIAGTLASIRADLTRLTHDALLAQVSGLVDATQVGKLGRFGYVPLTDQSRVDSTSGLLFDVSGAQRATEEEMTAYYYGFYAYTYQRSSYHYADLGSSQFTLQAGGSAANGYLLRSRAGPSLVAPISTLNIGSGTFATLLSGGALAYLVPFYHATAWADRIEVYVHDASQAAGTTLSGTMAVAGGTRYRNGNRINGLYQRHYELPSLTRGKAVNARSTIQDFETAMINGQQIDLVNGETRSFAVPPRVSHSYISGNQHYLYYNYLFLRGPLYDTRDTFYRFRPYRSVEATEPGVLTTAAQEAPQAPARVDVYVLVEAGDSFVPDTHLTASASRDDGETFSDGAGSWVDVGALAGGHLWCGTVDVSSQPEGQAVKAKLTLSSEAPTDVRLRLITFGGSA